MFRLLRYELLIYTMSKYALPHSAVTIHQEKNGGKCRIIKFTKFSMLTETLVNNFGHGICSEHESKAGDGKLQKCSK